VKYLISSKFITAAIYSPEDSLDIIMERMIDQVSSSIKNKKEKPNLDIALSKGKFRSEHLKVRRSSYLYVPIFDNKGDISRPLIEARDSSTNQLLGYIINFKTYIYDIAVDPDWSGYNVALYLIFALAKLMKAEDEPEIELDVRKHNFQAIQFYRKIGFEFDITLDNYNWHGGISLKAKVDKLLELMEQYKEKNIIKDFEI